jgi:hypothetical protein
MFLEVIQMVGSDGYFLEDDASCRSDFLLCLVGCCEAGDAIQFNPLPISKGVRK